MSAWSDITSESRLFQLDFAWIDFCFSLLLFCYLLATKRRIILIAGNIFGAISFMIDYGLYYLVQRSHNISYPKNHSPMTPMESFVFFLWFDWIHNATIVMWALLCMDSWTNILNFEDSRHSDTLLNNKKKERSRFLFNFVMLVSVPFWCWLTPWLSQYCSMDDRVILTTRPAEKYMYYVFFVLFVPLLRLERQISFQNIAKVLLTGVGCGIIQHSPLLFWGILSGATQGSVVALVVSLITAWPALLCGMVYCIHLFCAPSPRPSATKREQTRGRSRRTIILVLLGLFSVICVPQEFWESFDIYQLQLDKQFYRLLPHISAQTFQQISTAVVWSLTCSQVAPLLRTLDTTVQCFNSEGLRVLATTADEEGSVMGTKLSVVVGRACGKCVGAGQREFDSWPPPEEDPPAYPSDILLAMPNMPRWPAYAAEGAVNSSSSSNNNNNSNSSRSVKCVVMLRHPLARLRSLYLYARNGKEKWFVDSGVEARLDLPMHESVGQFITELGREYLLQSHSYLLFNIQQGCLPIKFEELRVNFNSTMSTWLAHWGIREEARPLLLELLQTENALNTYNYYGDREGEREDSNNHSELFISYVNGAIDKFDKGSMKAMIDEQAAELHYEARKKKSPKKRPKFHD